MESSTGKTDYRCLYLKNISAASSATTVRAWISSDASGADSIEIGLGAVGKNGVEQLLADENATPAGVTFSAPTEYATGIDLGDLSAGDFYPIWVKRTVPENTTTPTPNDNFTLGYGAELA